MTGAAQETGLAIAVVGPSGAGKDTLMAAALARDPRLHLARRVITRPADAGGEEFEAASVADFEARRAAGDFALSWWAHGLFYGIPASVRQEVAEGRIVLMNLSRGALAEAAALFPRFLTLYIHARPEILAARLAARGRESGEDLAARIRRAGQWAEGLAVPVTTIDNSDGIDPALEQFMSAIRKALK
ncbi:phosphonate metabolism protein/1,5-bisphosphokinase (PRPP-forming) PhnN [Paracoccus aminophilus]|uniref:Ribose 1,5-bisphosphate phosphokinase PhnN n=1 Tax=Paracoccus aminophilus JCM 7686 TaxID=1367847 RepID=S5Y270_PARAH|nr:phosphonate metabolism protein/1,5-bisphosphokinase (PRPP-forming) PhnN [Paracoccus aminophilus]AGT09845.1 alkylphosphonate utilization protein PhnN [Paracoccus aminophilus JCM 7686]